MPSRAAICRITSGYRFQCDGSDALPGGYAGQGCERHGFGKFPIHPRCSVRAENTAGGIMRDRNCVGKPERGHLVVLR